jgi:nucleotide-binding universal stress UspA family protein
MKTILAPTDFSNSSINAVNYAADMALATHAQLILVNAVQFPVAASEISLPESAMDEMIDLANNDLRELLNKLKKRTNDKISISSEVLIGPIEQQIEFASAAKKPLAIVMGIKPGKTFERALMGNTVFHTMNHTPYPVLIIPEDFQYSPIREIGVACDLLNPEDTLPIEVIKEWLSIFNAKLNIIYVTIKNREFKAAQLSESTSLQNRFQFFNPQFHYLQGSNLADSLNDFGKTHHLDLLIVIPKTSGLFDLFRKKHSKNLITHNRLPVLSIHELPAKIHAKLNPEPI